MRLLHNIGPRVNSNYNTIEEILADNESLTFDGVYLNVYEHREQLRGKDVTLFVMGAYVGKDNSFDTGMPLEKFCTWEQIEEMVRDYGFKLGWHTWSHPDLTKCSDEQLLHEVTPPSGFPRNSIGYPYGSFDRRVIDAVKAAGFKEGISVTHGDDSRYQRLRKYLNW